MNILQRTGLVAGLAVSAVVLASFRPALAQDKNSWSTIDRGHYLLQMGDCAACHTADESKPMAGDYPLPTPFGTIYTSNLTPDDETGIGKWTDDDFYRALNEGKEPDGTRLYPAFPYTHFTLVTREDSDAIFAYLKTLQPIHQQVRPPEFPFPLNIRLSLLGWNAINFDDRHFQPNPDKSREWNRGRYIAEGLAHCGMCHSPKNFMGAEKQDEAYSGGMTEGWFAPPLRNDVAGGLDNWSREDLIVYLSHGRNDRTSAFGPMADVISKSTSHLSDADIAALSTYILDLPQNEKDKEQEETEEREMPDETRMATGKIIYDAQCSACHTPDGDGVSGMFGRLKGSGIVETAEPTTMVKLILEGEKAVATDKYPTPHAMPAFNWKLTDQQIAAVATYVRNSFGNNAPAVSADTVKDLR